MYVQYQYITCVQSLTECLLLFQDAIIAYNQARKREWRFDALYSYAKVSDSITSKVLPNNFTTLSTDTDDQRAE